MAYLFLYPPNLLRVSTKQQCASQVSRQPAATPESLQSEYNKFEQAYIRGTAGTGSLRYQRLNDFRNGAFAALQQDVQQRANQAKQAELAAERQKAQQAREQIQKASCVLQPCNR